LGESLDAYRANGAIFLQSREQAETSSRYVPL
jgi:hypothetical protein